MTTVIDLTRQPSLEVNSMQTLMENYITSRLQRSFSIDETDSSHISTVITLSPLQERPNLFRSTSTQKPKDILLELRNKFNQSTHSKMKLVIQENSNFLSVLTQNFTFFHFQMILQKTFPDSAKHRGTPKTLNSSLEPLEEWSAALDCLLSILLPLEDYFFLLSEQRPKEFFNDFHLILVQILKEYQDRLGDNGQNNLFNVSLKATLMKIIVNTVRALGLLLCIIDSHTDEEDEIMQEREKSSLYNPAVIDKSLLPRTNERFKLKLFENISQILTILSDDVELYGRAIASALQKYLFRLTERITSSLHQFFTYVLTIPPSSPLPSSEQLLEKVQQLPIIQEYQTILTTICSHHLIYLYPVLVQSVLKCHAALCSFLEMAAPVITTNGSLSSSSTAPPPNSQLRTSQLMPQKGSLTFSSSTSTQSKNPLNQFFQFKNDTVDLTIKKRSFEEMNAASSMSLREKRLQEILTLFKRFTSNLLEMFELAHDIISQFLFSLYIHLYPSSSPSGNNSTWNYAYSGKACNQLITILTPFLFISAHHSISKISKLILATIIRFETMKATDTKPSYPQFKSISSVTASNDIPSIQALFSSLDKKSLIYSASFVTGVSMILKDEKGSEVHLQFLQLLTDTAKSSTNTNLIMKTYHIKALLFTDLTGIIDNCLRIFLQFHSTGIPPEVEAEKSNYIVLLIELFVCLCDRYEQFSYDQYQKAIVKQWIDNLQIVTPPLEKLLIHCMQRDLAIVSRFLDLFAPSTSKAHAVVEKQKEGGISDIWSKLEEEEDKRSLNLQNKRQKIQNLLDDDGRFKKQREEETEAESLWKWMDASRMQDKQTHPRGSLPTSASASTSKRNEPSSDWKKQLELLKKEQELARLKAKPGSTPASTSETSKTAMAPPPSLKRQSSPSFFAIDDETEGKKVDDEEEVIKQPVVLFNIHEYMKDSSKNQQNKNLSDEQKAIVETKRMLDMIEQRDRYLHQFTNYSEGGDFANIGDSIMSVSIDPICKEILSLGLSSLLLEYEEKEEETKEVEDGEVVVRKKKPEAEQQKSATSKQNFQPLPIRFTTAEQYISSFTPLLVEEFIAALTNVLINEDQGGSQSWRYTGGAAGTESGKEFQEILVQSELLVAKSTDKELMEVQVRLEDRLEDKDGKKGGSSKNRQLDLQKDELVLILKGHFLSSKIQRRRDLVRLKHSIGIVTQTTKKKMDTLISAPVNSSSSISGQYHTVLVKKTMDIHPRQPMMIIPIMNLSTFLREWTALHSIHNATLVPLAPYLMSGSPVCSPSIINSLSERITYKIKSIENMRKFQYSQEDITKIESSLIDEMHELSQLNVDPSILKATGIAKLLVTVVKRSKKQLTTIESAPSENKNPVTIENPTSASIVPAYVPLAEDLIERWRVLVREQSNAETIKNLKGGKVIKIPPKSEITQPSGLSPRLWLKLFERYNESQLYAIKYVVNQFDSKQDTRIGLIQGPPGSGKTSTIIGIISALLNHAGFSAASSNSSSTGRETANSVPPSEERRPNLPYTGSSRSDHQKRILICAPSNAAIDEILTRLAVSGIYNQDGEVVNNCLKIVRLGEAGGSSSSSFSSPLIQALTLDAQIEERMLKEDLYQKYLILQENLRLIEDQFYEKQRNLTEFKQSGSSNQAVLKNLEQQTFNLRQQMFEYRNQRLFYEISLDRLRHSLRQELLFEANIVGTTLSSAGKQQFLDYIMKENVFFTTCIIDEAGQTTEPSTLIPLRFGCRRLVLVGDPRQLPATVLSRKAEKFGLGRSLFERLEKAEHEVVMLTMQYRMHPEIRSFPSKYFYQNLLIDSPEIQQEISILSSLHNTSLLPTNQKYRVIAPILLENEIGAVEFVNITQSKEQKQGKSFINEVEMSYLIQFLVFLVKKNIITPPSSTSDTSEESMTVAIISPYKAQVRYIQQRCVNHPLLKPFFPSPNDLPSNNNSNSASAKTTNHHQIPIIEINTVDGFQGREKDIVLISTVRSNTGTPNRGPPNSFSGGRSDQTQITTSAIGRIGFVSDERRLNVAITRARKSLLIFGNVETLISDKVWREMIESLQQRRRIHSPHQLHFFS